MKTFATQRRLAAEILGVGKGRVWFDPERLTDIGEALTKADIKELIKDKTIKAKPAKIKHKGKRKKRGRRKTGSIKMKVKKRKQRYVKRIRKLRNYLKMLKLNVMITIQQYHNLRKLAKAGQFKSKRHLQDYIQKLKIEGPEKPKKGIEKPKQKEEKTKTKKAKGKNEKGKI